MAKIIKKTKKNRKKSNFKSIEPYKKTAKIDLHGLRQVEATESLEKCINDSILGNVDQIEVIHGKGSGKVKAAIWKLAKSLQVVKSIREDTNNPGTSWIYL